MKSWSHDDYIQIVSLDLEMLPSDASLSAPAFVNHYIDLKSVGVSGRCLPGLTGSLMPHLFRMGPAGSGGDLN